MVSRCSIDLSQFVPLAKGFLQAGDIDGLALAVRSQWRPAQIAALLGSEDVTLRRLAAATLGAVGDPQSIVPLARALHDPDAQVNELAEHSLWSIWFRIGDLEASEPFLAGVDHANHGRCKQAVIDFTKAITIDPAFAEAYHQRALAYAAMDLWEECLDDCRVTVGLMPQHFCAQATMGHCLAQMGDLAGAANCYRHAMALNPRLNADLLDITEKVEASLMQVSEEDAQAPAMKLAGTTRGLDVA